jgi:hypothetical protein
LPSITLPFDPVIGPVFNCVVARPVSLLPIGVIPTGATSVRFLVDTGASHTCVNHAIAVRANLHVLGLVAVQSTTQQISVNTYLADMFIPIGNPGVFLSDVQLSELLLGNPFFDGLLGRDLLTRGQLYLNGVAGMFTLTF